MAIEPHAPSNKELTDALLALAEDKDHEGLDNLMGGNADGHYHLTQTQVERLMEISDILFPEEGAKINIDHEKLTNLLGGIEAGHYHLKENELQWLNFLNSKMHLNVQSQLENGYPQIDHNKLDGLQGGENGEFYHLTKDEQRKLQKLITFAFGDGSVIDITHASLREVMPSNSYQYHLKKSQYETIKDWIDNGIPLSLDAESWTFTLDNGSTVTKKVAIWTDTGNARLTARGGGA